jgi:hypothetical protein
MVGSEAFPPGVFAKWPPSWTDDPAFSQTTIATTGTE